MQEVNQIVRIPFCGGEIETLNDGEKVWVSVKRVCEELGISSDAQRVKLKEKEWATTAMNAVMLGDRPYHLFMIDTDSLPMWLATIETSRIADDIKPILIQYQKEAAKVLRDYFFGSKTHTQSSISDKDYALRMRELDIKEKELNLKSREMDKSDLETKVEGFELYKTLALKSGDESLYTQFDNKIAELKSGTKHIALLPTEDETVSWKSPTEIAADYGVSSQRIGKVVTSLWGKKRTPIDDVRILKGEIAAHGKKAIKVAYYSPLAVGKIENELKRKCFI